MGIGRKMGIEAFVRRARLANSASEGLQVRWMGREVGCCTAGRESTCAWVPRRGLSRGVLVGRISGALHDNR